MRERVKKNAWLLGSGIVLGMAMTLATVWVVQDRGANAGDADQWQLPAELLHAAASAGNDAFAIATGPIAESEGLFLLDFLTGELQCSVVYPRNRQVGAYFRANVAQTLGADQTKKPRYLMATAQMSFRRGVGPQLANCICYVVDANTGNFAAYAVPWNPNMEASGNPQHGQLILLAAGKARNVEIGE